jgi:hypothetical protein
MRGQSRILELLAVEVATIVLMLSCASSRPLQAITVHVPSGFTGTIRVSTCNPAAPATDISANSSGVSETSACPSRETGVDVVVMRGDQRYTPAPESVSILRTGDGIATSLRIEVR